MINNEQTALDIVAKIESDINDRCGMHMSDFDKDIQEQILETWKQIILQILDKNLNDKNN